MKIVLDFDETRKSGTFTVIDRTYAETSPLRAIDDAHTEVSFDRYTTKDQPVKTSYLDKTLNDSTVSDNALSKYAHKSVNDSKRLLVSFVYTDAKGLTSNKTILIFDHDGDGSYVDDDYIGGRLFEDDTQFRTFKISGIHPGSISVVEE